jgi:hypothetical protein
MVIVEGSRGRKVVGGRVGTAHHLGFKQFQANKLLCLLKECWQWVLSEYFRLALNLDNG